MKGITDMPATKLVMNRIRVEKSRSKTGKWYMSCPYCVPYGKPNMAVMTSYNSQPEAMHHAVWHSQFHATAARR